MVDGPCQLPSFSKKLWLGRRLWQQYERECDGKTAWMGCRIKGMKVKDQVYLIQSLAVIRKLLSKFTASKILISIKFPTHPEERTRHRHFNDHADHEQRMEQNPSISSWSSGRSWCKTYQELNQSFDRESISKFSPWSWRSTPPNAWHYQSWYLQPRYDHLW